MKFLNDKRKFLIVVPLLVLIAMCYFFDYAFKEFEYTQVREKAWDKQQELNLLSNIIGDLAGIKGYEDGHLDEIVLRRAIEDIEKNFTSTFAQLYDDKLTPLIMPSAGVGGGRKHNPLDYPEFVKAVRNNEFGSLVYWYETEQAGGRDVYMSYRWTPGTSNRYLLAVGVSKYTIKESLGAAIVYGAIALMLVTMVSVSGAVYMKMRLTSGVIGGNEGGGRDLDDRDDGCDHAYRR